MTKGKASLSNKSQYFLLTHTYSLYLQLKTNNSSLGRFGGRYGRRCRMRGNGRRVRAMGAGSHCARRLRARSTARERQQSDIARALDGHAQSALVPRANAGHATGQNLTAFLHELRQNVRALVVDEVDLLDAKLADFLLAEILPLSSWAPAGAAGTSRSAFAPSATRTAFAPRRSAWRWCLLLFLCHTCHLSLCPGQAGANLC
jgi:hypothetical protein